MTGATGFIGGVVLARLREAGFGRITCLTRRPRDSSETLRWVVGELDDPASYSQSLLGADCVIHLAAATGSASEAELTRINVEGTRALAKAAKAAGVPRFLHMSSIAAGYSALAEYPYGRTKLEAEHAVRESGLHYVIVRPTIVLGPGSPLWSTLRKLACLPVVPAFGGGSARVQPVDVEDVARAVAAIAGDARFDSTVIEMGGPEALTFASFLRRIRAACGQGSGLMLHVPVFPIRLGLKLARGILGERFPISPGQLSPLTQDGTARPNPVYEALRPSMQPLDAMLSDLARVPAAAPTKAADDLPAECRAFTRYLTGRDPDDYVIGKYLAVQSAVLRGAPPRAPIDDALVSFAARGAYRARIADAYARIARPHGTLRRKLILLFAILENSRAFHRDFTAGGSGAAWLAVPRIALAVAAFALALGIGIVAFAPRQLLARGRSVT
jgi:nucleoside-diphosphate-sugar epimerase